MREPPRRTYTFNWFSFWPRWRSYHFTPRPVNWLLFRWYDWIVLAVVLAAPVGLSDVAAWIAAIFYFFIFPVIVWRRRRARRRYCATQGHTPHRVGAGEWECLYCGTPIEVNEPQTVATSVAMAEAEVDLARRRKEPPQSYWSDRR